MQSTPTIPHHVDKSGDSLYLGASISANWNRHLSLGSPAPLGAGIRSNMEMCVDEVRTWFLLVVLAVAVDCV